MVEHKENVAYMMPIAVLLIQEDGVILIKNAVFMILNAVILLPFPLSLGVLSQTHVMKIMAKHVAKLEEALGVPQTQHAHWMTLYVANNNLMVSGVLNITLLLVILMMERHAAYLLNQLDNLSILGLIP